MRHIIATPLTATGLAPLKSEINTSAGNHEETAESLLTCGSNCGGADVWNSSRR
jgi:hypothetical protein